MHRTGTQVGGAQEGEEPIERELSVRRAGWSRLLGHSGTEIGVGQRSDTLWRSAICRVCVRALAVFVAVVVLGCPTAGLGASGQADALRSAGWAQFTQQSDGLLVNDIRSIWASDYALWFGGDGGVSVYDGSWTAYADVGAEPGGTLIQALTGDTSSGVVWAGTVNGTLLRREGDTWQTVADLRTPIFALAQVENALWVGSADGLYRYHNGAVTLVDAVGRQPVFALLVDVGGETEGVTVWVGALGGLWRYREERWAQVSASDEQLRAGVLALARLPGGGLAAGGQTGLGIQPREGARWEWREVLDEYGVPAPVQALAVDLDGNLWAGTNGAGALRVDGRSGAWTAFGYTGDTRLTTRYVRAVAIDRDGSVWFATPAGVFRHQAALWTADVVGAPEDVRNHINALLAAPDQSLWIATAGAGLRRKMSDGRVETYDAGDGAPAAAYALALGQDGSIWAGGEGGLRRYADDRWREPVARDRLPSPVVTSLLVDAGALLVGTTAGLAIVNEESLQVEFVAALAGRTVAALARDTGGRVWVGTVGDGIWRRELSGTWSQLPVRGLVELPGRETVAAHGLAPHADNPDGMWVALEGVGLASWDGSQWRMVGATEFAPSNLIWTLYTDPVDGTLWIGSEAGVTRYDGLSTVTLGVADGLQSANIYAITRMPDGSYWFGGRTGLSRFQPEQTPPWLRIESIAGQLGQSAEGVAQAAVGEPLQVRLAAGDLQDGRDLALLARVTGPLGEGAWTPFRENPWRETFARAGRYQVEFMARDRSFNYSPVVVVALEVVLPPSYVQLPWLGQVERSVYHTLLILGTMVVLGVAYMTTAVVQRHRRSVRALVRGYNPYISGEPVRRDDMFFGRRDLLQRIIDTLHNNSIMLYGERRIGKTTLLYQLVVALREVDDPDYWFVPVYVDLEGTPQEIFFHYLAEEIVAAVELLPEAGAEITPDLADLRYHVRHDHAYTDRDFYRDLNRITAVLENYGSRHAPGKQLRLILLIDEMDVMTKYDRIVQQQLRRIFMREFSDVLGAVVAGIQINREWDRVESPWFNMFNEIALTPFTREQAIELLVEPVRGYYQYEPAALEFILEKAEGRPYRLQQYGMEAVNHMLAEKRRRILLRDAEAAHQRIQAADAAGQNGKPTGLWQRLRPRRLESLWMEPGEQKAAPDHQVSAPANGGAASQSERPYS